MILIITTIIYSKVQLLLNFPHLHRPHSVSNIQNIYHVTYWKSGVQYIIVIITGNVLPLNHDTLLIHFSNRYCVIQFDTQGTVPVLLYWPLTTFFTEIILFLCEYQFLLTASSKLLLLPWHIVASAHYRCFFIILPRVMFSFSLFTLLWPPLFTLLTDRKSNFVFDDSCSLKQILTTCKWRAGI